MAGRNESWREAVMLRFHTVRSAEFAAAPSPPVEWVWEGIVAERNITLLTSLWKAGKSTLLAMLLARRHSGNALLDRFIQPGGSAVVTEEPADLWQRRARHLDLGPNVSFYCRPFTSTPQRSQWLDLIEQLAEEKKEHGVNLVAFDPLIHVLPCHENNATAVREALEPLRRLTDAGMAVLLLHHPAKREAGAGKSARGNGALHAFADVLLELRIPVGDPSGYQRSLHGYSRHQVTPRQICFEMNVTETDYKVISDQDVSDDFSANWHRIEAILTAAADAPLTRQEVLARWPAERNSPHPGTLWRWLTRAQELALVVVTGHGTKLEPCRYQLRVKEQKAG
jgi:hypothetical protein